MVINYKAIDKKKNLKEKLGTIWYVNFFAV